MLQVDYIKNLEQTSSRWARMNATKLQEMREHVTWWLSFKLSIFGSVIHNHVNV